MRIEPASLTEGQVEALNQMNELRIEKMKGWTVTPIKEWFPVSQLEAPTILGSFSWTQTSKRNKWIKKFHAHDFGAGWVSPADVARDYLHYKYGRKRLRCSTPQWEEVVQKKRAAPLAVRVGEVPKGVYLDLVSAYWQIILAVGWDVDYMPNRFLSKRSHNADFPMPFLKLARNSLVSLGVPTGMRMWKDGEIIFMKSGSSTVNLIMWGLVQDVLNGVAWDMLRAGAKYVHTDGYIFDEQNERTAYEVADSWGLRLEPKYRGYTHVQGVGAYKIGQKQTRRKSVRRKDFCKVNPVHHDWLRRKFRFWSEHAESLFS